MEFKVKSNELKVLQVVKLQIETTGNFYRS